MLNKYLQISLINRELGGSAVLLDTITKSESASSNLQSLKLIF